MKSGILLTMSEFKYKNEIYRKFIHLSSLWIPAASYHFEKPIMLYVFGGLCVLALVYEIVRQQDNALSKILNFLFSRVLRDEEKQENFKLSGAIYVFISAFLCVLFFSKLIAVTSMLVMIVGDAAAALIGRKFGRIKFKSFGKSLEGSAAFFTASFLTVLLIPQIIQVQSGYIFASSVAIFIATFVEFISKKIHIDDNLSIPLTVGGVMMFLM